MSYKTLPQRVNTNAVLCLSRMTLHTNVYATANLKVTWYFRWNIPFFSARQTCLFDCKVLHFYRDGRKHQAALRMRRCFQKKKWGFWKMLLWKRFDSAREGSSSQSLQPYYDYSLNEGCFVRVWVWLQTLRGRVGGSGLRKAHSLPAAPMFIPPAKLR